ncbi:transcriptional regulator GutM [Alicyclobacillus fastidiosus]|uniref:Transcriptional regulator GutM n=1 Tax=Alicyclobacillus fastidiosus TaxID=392011 RepID=A0ABV5ABL8_9BACL|nr:transcriptional regulator GutM [Alicyclobacillus fastidiosus]WEH10568.1 transcriptional regulator GutM [Alicyclobacillus fastidiosus]
MHPGNLIILVGSAWILQYVFTWFQLQHYRKTMRTLVQAYKGREDYSLFSGVCRKALGKGAIVIAIVDSNEVIHRCEVLSGMSVFAKFKPLDGYVGRSLTDIGTETREIISRKRSVSSQKKSLAKALLMVVENAQRSNEEKRRQVSRRARVRKVMS